MIRRRRAARAARRRIERTLENTAARERAQAAIEGEEQEEKLPPRTARHVDQLDLLLTRGAITYDQAKAGAKFNRDYERSMSTIGRLVGAYDADLIRRPGKGSPPPDTPASIEARERFEAAGAVLGPLLGIALHVCVLDQPPESWGVPPKHQNGDATALLRLALAVLTQHYSSRAFRVDQFPHMSESAEPAPASWS
jgi:hypothetical protein